MQPAAPPAAPPAALPPATSGAIISEFRFRGPGSTAANASRDEYIELLNTTSAPLNIAGWKIRFTSGGVLQTVTVNADAILPARGHYLVTNSVDYSLSSTAMASADQSFTADGDDESGITLLDAGGAVVDAVTAGGRATAREEFAFVRENEKAGSAINRAAAFCLVSTTVSATG